MGFGWRRYLISNTTATAIGLPQSGAGTTLESDMGYDYWAFHTNRQQDIRKRVGDFLDDANIPETYLQYIQSQEKFDLKLGVTCFRYSFDIEKFLDTFTSIPYPRDSHSAMHTTSSDRVLAYQSISLFLPQIKNELAERLINEIPGIEVGVGVALFDGLLNIDILPVQRMKLRLV